MFYLVTKIERKQSRWTDKRVYRNLKRVFEHSLIDKVLM